ncbi:MAG: hypothetical protein ACOY93_20455 [Bacillota bacterium]
MIGSHPHLEGVCPKGQRWLLVALLLALLIRAEGGYTAIRGKVIYTPAEQLRALDLSTGMLLFQAGR